jgi:hypothetical protein
MIHPYVSPDLVDVKSLEGYTFLFILDTLFAFIGLLFDVGLQVLPQIPKLIILFPTERTTVYISMLKLLNTWLMAEKADLILENFVAVITVYIDCPDFNE